MSDQQPPPPPPAYVPTAEDDYAFRRRRTHAHIEAMSGLILQAIAYPTRRHRDFICALQSANSGNDAKVPYTPFRRAHLTIADYMKHDGSPETRRKAVYREICCLRRFQRQTGIVIFHVTPGNEEEATEYIDYLTPLADAAMQRALSSPIWKTDKAEARRQAVAWAVSMLPRIPIEEETEEEATELSLHDYERAQEERFYQSIERTADEIEKRGGDHRWIERVAKQLLQIASSRKKTAGARRPNATLRAAGAQAAGVEGGTEDESGDLYNVGQFRPVTESDTSERGEDRTVLPPPSDAAVAAQDDAKAGGQGGRTELSSPPPDHLEAALTYARRGWAVFPLHHPVEGNACSCSQGKACRSTGKHPRTRQGLKDATTNEGQVRAWWRRWPEANVGLAMGRTSGLVALDVDPRSGGDASLAELFDEHESFPATLEALTGGGGFHFLFSHPGVKFKNSSSVLGEGLDIKTDGGYIVAAPSLHASGKRYEWRGTAAPSPLPEWLLTLLTTERAKPEVKAAAAAPRRATTLASTSGRLIPEGERNKQLFRIACAHRGNGATREEIEAAVAEAYEARCEKQPAMGTEEFRKIAGSAMRYQPEAKKRAARAQGATT
ncbi:MAG TPA: bifunctional DNA primase/polymerase [Pyrinomonadaceae bacterium]|nr:bifunctional DNA primase/polymerase [Pyrinomonadaceae bacterium]